MVGLQDPTGSYILRRMITALMVYVVAWLVLIAGSEKNHMK
jgi:hypothetical protein